MNRELAKSIGMAARQARKQLQLTQEDAAERIEVSVEFYARIERGTSLPSILTFARIVSALGVSADALLGRHPAFVQAGPSWTPQQTDESPEIRRLVRRLRKANPSALRLVSLLLRELETAPVSNEQFAAMIELESDTTESAPSDHADDIQPAAAAAG
jgi:transcriptional regulator with XRE-family HTH domain